MTVPDIAGLIAGALPAAVVVNASAERAEYALNGLCPAAVARVTEAEQVAVVLGVAQEHGLAVSPRGGGSMLDLGNPIERLDIVLDLRGLDTIVDYQPDDLTLTVQGGVMAGDIARLLEQRGQSLPLDIPLPDTATIGGALATNAHGPRRLRYGTARDLVIGMQVAQPLDGLARSGGKVVKNVAGYDLAKLHIGGLGTAGVITEITFKLWPAPAACGAVIASFYSCEAAHAVAMQAIHGQLFPTAVDLAGPPFAQRLCEASGAESASGQWLLASLLQGVPAAVQRQSRGMAALCTTGGATAVTSLDKPAADRLFARLRDFGRSIEDPASLVLRVSVLPSRTAAAAGVIEDNSPSLGGRPELLLRPGSGTVLANWAAAPADRLVDAIRRLRASLAQIGGGLVVERCPSAVAALIEVWGVDGRDVALMQRLKQTYDPNSTLNPGRFAGRI